MRLDRILGAVGRLLIWVGSIILLFVAYQLWGTGLAEARAQDSLEDRFAELLAESGRQPGEATTTTEPAAATTTTTTTTAPPDPAPPPTQGDVLGRIVIPAIGVDKYVVEGVSRSNLQDGPGHFPGTPLPGREGNAAIAGHRTTYGAPFHRVDELVPGDEIQVTTVEGTFTYVVSGTAIVSPSQVDVVQDQGDDRLTLSSCHPKYSARQRIIVSAILQGDPVDAPPVVDADPVPDALPGEDDEPRSEPEPELTSLDGEDTRRSGPAVRWGTAVAAVWAAFYALSRTWRRWPSYLLGAPVFGLALWTFFGALTEALPPNF